MDIREGIKSQFNDLGYEVSEVVLDKCVEICVLHNIDEETFVETWTAYSVTNLNGDGPSLETVLQMERKEFVKQDKFIMANISNSNHVTTSLPVFSGTPKNKKPAGESWNQLDTTPKGVKNSSVFSNKLSTSCNGNSFSPSSFSPNTTVSSNYATRTNAGVIVCEHGERIPTDWIGKEITSLNVVPYNKQVLTPNCKIMLEPLSEKADVLNDVIISYVGKRLVDLNGLQEPSSNYNVSLTEVVCIGRVCCDSNEHLNSSSVILEGSQNLCLGQSVALDLSRLGHYALFPGEVVAVTGVNPTGQQFIVNKLFHSAPLPLPPSLPTFTDAMDIVIAAGPFTQIDSVSYAPLEDLMKYVNQRKPHVLILIGPVIDIRQPHFINGPIDETYDTLFENIMKKVVEQLKEGSTKVVVISSADDATCLPVFPTPPFSVCRSTPSISFFSDPCLISINGLVIGLTATDSLMHLGRDEICFPPGGSDRLGRLASHLLEQQSFYPLSPPGDEITVDSDLWDCYATLPITPHVLVTPSHFRHFIKIIHGCFMVNPEHLAKGRSGGTFARLKVEPPTDRNWSPTTHISAQIIKI